MFDSIFAGGEGKLRFRVAGAGSRFSLTLPEAGAAPTLETSEDGLDLPEDPGGRVLIVEDNSIARHGLEALLAQWGYQTIAPPTARRRCFSPSGKTGASARSSPISGSAPGSGVEAAKEILRRSGRALPTLVLTGDTAGEAIAEIGASGFELMLKPIAAEPLRPALARLMGARDPPSRRRSGSAVGQRAGS